MSCRKLDGVRNLCSPCAASMPRPVAPKAMAVEVEPATRALSSARSPTLAAILSLIPGLGQVYTGRFARGVAFFGSALLLRDAAWLSPIAAAYLYVFNLFDAYRIAQNRSEGHARGKAPPRADDTLFLLAGFATLAVTLLDHGGFVSVPRATVIPLAGLAAGLLFAHETRG
jgi:hypothetical protein